MRPRLERFDDRVLDGVFSDVEVAHRADEGGQHEATLMTHKRLERVRLQPAWEKSMQGRTSTLPCHAPGIC